MLPGPMLFRETILSVVDGTVLPPKELSILSDRADLDAYSARRYALLIQLSAVGGAACLVSQSFRIISLIQRLNWTHPDAAHASGAQLFSQKRARWKLCSS